MNGSQPQRFARGRRSISTPLRVLAAVVTALFSLSSLAEVAHFMLVPHAVCAEHGELVELDHGEHVEEHSTSAKPDANEHRDAPRDDGGGEDHDHCQLVASGQRDLGPPMAASAALVPVTNGIRLCTDEVTPRLAGRAPLSLAPKTSPPAAG